MATQTQAQAQPLARTLPYRKLAADAPFRWLSLAILDIKRAPGLSLTYGLIFSLIPVAMLYLTLSASTHLVILPAMVAFALIGPVFAVGLYDVAWELEKGHRPSVGHSLRSMLRNPVGEWGFAIVLMVIMIAWLRIATLIHALYPTLAAPGLADYLSFLAVGSVTGLVLLGLVFAISAFTPQICLERRVDIMTAMVTSVQAVKGNLKAMLVWASIILSLVGFGFLTSGLAFILIMPLLSFASWHAYIATIETKRPRSYE